MEEQAAQEARYKLNVVNPLAHVLLPVQEALHDRVVLPLRRLTDLLAWEDPACAHSDLQQPGRTATHCHSPPRSTRLSHPLSSTRLSHAHARASHSHGAEYDGSYFGSTGATVDCAMSIAARSLALLSEL